MKKTAIISVISLLFVSFKAQAVCPVCTVAAGAGLGFARWLGIDDSVTGLWIGALLMSITGWTINWLSDKKWTFPFMETTSFVLWYGLTLIPLWLAGMLGAEGNQLWGVDKVLLGVSIGTIAFLIGMHLDSYLRTLKLDRKAHFPFQKVVLPLSMLIVATLVFYFLTK